MIICFFQVNKTIDLFLLLIYLLVIISIECKNKSKQNVLYKESIKTSYFGDW